MHVSNSREQQYAESFILKQLNLDEGYNLIPSKVSLPCGSLVQIDGYDQEKKVLCEVYARIGKLKGSQPDKLASDFLKMLFIEKEIGELHTKIFCFVSDDAKAYLTGKSWLGAAAKKFGITIKTIPLPPHLQESIKDAQLRQKMVNSSF
ncbi:MAG: hypothetical protein R3219_07755 [Hydrogenovibrio sp.]|nr:hypothetical protein [Hydrogenovibrio sp.]